MSTERSLRVRNQLPSDDKEEFIQRVVERILLSDSILNKICDKICDRIVDSIKTSVIDRVYEEMENVFLPMIKDMQEQINSLKSALNTKTDDLESYSRRNNIRVYGINETTNEDTTQQFVDICKQKMGITINKTSIDRCHRLKHGKVGSRPIIVKFSNSTARDTVFFNKTKLKGTSIVIREDLTKLKNDVYKEACKTLGRKNVWTTNSKVYASVRNRRIVLNSVDEVRKISSTE